MYLGRIVGLGHQGRHGPVDVQFVSLTSPRGSTVAHEMVMKALAELYGIKGTEATKFPDLVELFVSLVDEDKERTVQEYKAGPINFQMPLFAKQRRRGRRNG